MRVGINPVKNKKISLGDFFHHVVIPVYIPNEEGYYKDAVNILQKCIQSLKNTSHNNTFISIIDNGSHKKIAVLLRDYYDKGIINEIIHTQNIGKVNAFFKAIAGYDFPLITIADADVLFIDQWQEETYKVFQIFPQTGFVSTTPQPKLLRYCTDATLIKYLISKKLRFVNTKDPEALKMFVHSIGNENFYKPVHFKKSLALKDENFEVVIGSGHFIATYRKEVFENLKKPYTDIKLGAESVRNYLDKPISKAGYWRLSTSKNYTYHMGNKSEDWMDEILKKQNQLFKNKTFEKIDLPNVKPNNNIKQFIISKLALLLYKKPIWNWYLKYKGLTSEEAKMF